MRPLASRLSVLSGEGALTVYSRAKELERQGRSIIHLELGEPDFHPAEPVIASLEKALREGKDRYCPMAGVPALKEELALSAPNARLGRFAGSGRHRSGLQDRTLHGHDGDHRAGR